MSVGMGLFKKKADPLSERARAFGQRRSEEHTSELQSRLHLVCRLLLEKKNMTAALSLHSPLFVFLFFFFNDTATTEIYTLSLHDALPICLHLAVGPRDPGRVGRFNFHFDRA